MFINKSMFVTVQHEYDLFQASEADIWSSYQEKYIDKIEERNPENDPDVRVSDSNA